MIYLICTPIGNLNDISTRSIEILNSSDLIFAEDTRKAKKLFNKFKITLILVDTFDPPIMHVTGFFLFFMIKLID